MPIFSPWQLSDRVWDLIVTHPALGSDRGGVDIRRVVRPTDPYTSDVAVYWFNREFRDNPPVNYPLIVLYFDGYSVAAQPAYRVELVKFVLPDGGILYRESPIWYDFSWTISLYADNERQFEDIGWDIVNGVFPFAYGVRFIDIDPPNGVFRTILLNTINTSFTRSEPVYRRDFRFVLQQIALFGKALQEEDVEAAREDTILSWFANLTWRDLRGKLQSEVLVKEF